MSLPRGRPSPWKTQAPMSDIPSPLHIIKRTKTVEFHHKTKRQTSNGSIDYGPDRPLSVMKKRQCPGPVDQVASSARPREKQATSGKSTFKMSGLKPNADWISSTQRQPKSQAPLRWFSRQRTSSSGTTCRRYSLQSRTSSSDRSSMEHSSNVGFLDGVSTLEPYESRSLTQMDASFSSMPPLASYGDDCHLLVPRISITSEVQTSNNAISTVLATIEISVRLSRPYTDTMLDANFDDGSLLSNPLRVGSVSRFGYLYNLQVDVFPTSQTAVIEIIEDDRKRILNLGSTILVLAKVKIDRRRPRQPKRAIVRKSNELIADLESELGLARIKYLQVRLQYHHSGFSTLNDATPMDGTTDYQTQLKTTATGVIDQQALHSPLNPSHFSANESSLFGIVASYWGPLRANEIFSQKTRQANSIVAKNTALVDDNQIVVAKDGFNHQATTAFGPTTSLSRRRADPQPSSPDQGDDPARKIWTEMRRRVSHNRPNRSAANAENSPAAAARTMTGTTSTIASSMRMKSEVDHRRELIRDVALRNKRSIGAESLKSLVPSMMNLEMSSKEAWGDSSSNTSNKENVPPERRKEGRWSLAGWW
ncbi:hypothetical protein F4801DRAFT_159494 [Xylaria longipes]|nr:hypothetical protein F4801DRAFT_159494 [Xylaria longipes]